MDLNFNPLARFHQDPELDEALSRKRMVVLNGYESVIVVAALQSVVEAGEQAWQGNHEAVQIARDVIEKVDLRNAQ